MGSVDIVSQLLSWNQAPGLPRMVPSMAAATVESGRRGPSKRGPFAEAADMFLAVQGWEVAVAYRSGVPVWEGDLEVCVFSLENFLWLWVQRMRVGSSRISFLGAVAYIGLGGL